MIFGDESRRINDRTDSQGLHTYTMVPDIWAIMQSGNLYMYTMHNPVFFNDSSGLFAIPAAIAFVPLAAAFLVTFTAALLLDQNFHNAFNTAIADLSDRIQGFAQRFGRSEAQVKNDLRELAGGTTPGNPPPNEPPESQGGGREFAQSSRSSREVNRFLEQNGFRHVRQSGSHATFSNGTNSVTVPQGQKDVPFGTLQSILKRANLW